MVEYYLFFFIVFIERVMNNCCNKVGQIVQVMFLLLVPSNVMRVSTFSLTFIFYFQYQKFMDHNLSTPEAVFLVSPGTSSFLD
jgi:hypothetical protein